MILHLVQTVTAVVDLDSSVQMVLGNLGSSDRTALVGLGSQVQMVLAGLGS